MRIGSHVSIRYGYLGAAQETVKMGGEAFQYFPKNPRNLTIKSFDRKDAEACARYCEEHQLVSIAHTPYPTEIAVEGEEMKQLTIQSMLNDLEIAEACGSVGVVIHFGKYKGNDPLQGYRNMIATLNSVLSDWSGDSLILLENNAGQGVRMGTTLDELVKIRSLCHYPEKIGFCLDTCHAFASGLWNGENLSLVIEHGQKLGYFQHLKAIHLNDSMYPTRSFRDRHANIGKGHIGVEKMKDLLTNPIFRDLPFILETPTSLDYTHKEEIQFVGSLL
jgi:deoxyribonuclease-4